MKRVLILFLFVGISHFAWSQATSCAQTLRLATSTYEQGRLHELEGILEKCLVDGFTKEEKVSALKLLTQAYIYLEEPDKANASMQKLLETDHYFEVNPEIDPAEFIALYKTFRTEPVYALGGKIGLGLTTPLLMSDYYTSSGSQGTGKFSPGLSFMGGISFEKKIYKNFTINPELLFASLSYSSSSKLFEDDITGAPAGSIESTYKQTWLALNALVQYEMGKGVFKTYVLAGPGVGYCVKSAKQTVTTGLSQSAVSGRDVDLKDSTTPFLYSISVGGGFKYRIGSIIVVFEVRYQQSLNNVFQPDSRSNIENVADYGDQLNDMLISSLSGAVGVSIPVFKPAKLSIK